MSLDALQSTIFTAVAASQDEALLQDVIDILLQSESDSNETYYRKRLDESTRQADAGILTPASVVHTIARQRVTK